MDSKTWIPVNSYEEVKPGAKIFFSESYLFDRIRYSVRVVKVDLENNRVLFRVSDRVSGLQWSTFKGKKLVNYRLSAIPLSSIKNVHNI